MLIRWHEKLMGQKGTLFSRERQACVSSELFQILLAVLWKITVYGYLIYAVWSKGEMVANFSLYFGAAMSFSGNPDKNKIDAKELRLIYEKR